MVHYKERVTGSDSYFNCAIESLYPHPSMSVCPPPPVPPSHLQIQSKPICDPGRVRARQRWLACDLAFSLCGIIRPLFPLTTAAVVVGTPLVAQIVLTH